LKRNRSVCSSHFTAYKPEKHAPLKVQVWACILPRTLSSARVGRCCLPVSPARAAPSALNCRAIKPPLSLRPLNEKPASPKIDFNPHNKGLSNTRLSLSITEFAGGWPHAPELQNGEAAYLAKS